MIRLLEHEDKADKLSIWKSIAKTIPVCGDDENDIHRTSEERLERHIK